MEDVSKFRKVGVITMPESLQTKARSNILKQESFPLKLNPEVGEYQFLTLKT